jgi:GH15 family glucan-1,4-alpha-glucosidase
VPEIADYALIGDCHSAALVSRDGSIDWACFPAFDSPAVFCRILDKDRGGAFLVQPATPFESSRTYLEDTNVLCTSFRTGTGVLELTDCMPLETRQDAPQLAHSGHAILRRLHCVSGEVEVRLHLEPRFEYASFTPRFTGTSDRTCEVVGGADALWVTASRPLSSARDWIEARWKLVRGETAWIQIAWSPAHQIHLPALAPGEQELAQMLDRTIRFWREWMKSFEYDGDHAALVRRSALVLKALTYLPTGAVVSAPTTSLPETIGGVRNWDYRYTWIRDASLTLLSLYTLGFRREADAFKLWLERTGAGRPQDLQVLYGISGRRFLPEFELPHLAGHLGSTPVRIGNGAAKRLQLDCYGQIIEAAHLYMLLGGALTASNWEFLRSLVDVVAEGWRASDHGVWEMRAQPRHFLHSKLMCWVALDRAIQIAESRSVPAPLDRWRREREGVRDYLLAEARRVGWFPQAAGYPDADASVLLVSAVGFVPPRDPLMSATIDKVLSELGSEGLLYRYRSSDGLPGNEGTFLLCSFWLIDALAHAGRIEQAEHAFGRACKSANDVGLLAEQADPHSARPLGNFPHAFTHMALVTSSAHLTLARRGELPDAGSPYNFSELLLRRLLEKYGTEDRRG